MPSWPEATAASSVVQARGGSLLKYQTHGIGTARPEVFWTPPALRGQADFRSLASSAEGIDCHTDIFKTPAWTPRPPGLLGISCPPPVHAALYSQCFFIFLFRTLIWHRHLLIGSDPASSQLTGGGRKKKTGLLAVCGMQPFRHSSRFPPCRRSNTQANIRSETLGVEKETFVNFIQRNKQKAALSSRPVYCMLSFLKKTHT